MDPRDRARFGRQMKLPEVGEAGQALLSSAAPALGGAGFAREVERTYLRLAGAAATDEGVPAEVDVASLGLRHTAAREVGEGALRALAAVRAILGVGT